MQERSPQGVLPLAEAWKLLRCEKHWSAAKQPELQQSDERSGFGSEPYSWSHRPAGLHTPQGPFIPL